LPYYCDYNKDSQNIATLFVNVTERKDWPARISLEPEILNVENQPLVEPSKILLPFLHLKLGLMKYFVKIKKKLPLLRKRKVPQIK
jgi:hypothetical protein